ncbi:hypothetical protein [Flavobacterium sp. 245]|uniref:hypothetical protein n=1 Tax=Flavobacterium sp. 245 TaxID=2512115 RepID=UPI0010606D35|nr:hypothetical protein [Flavobacterium sp. 245]TDO94909.1 hypothetical protein EV145_11634 [Flavobacterium sp. 245]
MHDINKGIILVHDSSRGFSKFLKSHYSNKFTIEVHKKKKELVSNQFDGYSFGFINICAYDDLIYVKFIESKVKFVFIVSAKKEFNEIKFDSKKVCFLDSFNLKSDIIKQINIQIKLMEVNSTISSF